MTLLTKVTMTMNLSHITRTERGWELRKQGATRPSKTASSREALLKLTAIFLRDKPALVRLYHPDGSLQEERRYPPEPGANGP